MKYILAGLLALFGVNSYALTTVNVLTMFTPGAAAIVGNDAAMASKAAQQVGFVNQAFSNSGIGSSVQAVNVGWRLYNDTYYDGPITDIKVGRLKFEDRAIHNRSETKADLVVLLTNGSGSTQGIVSNIPLWIGNGATAEINYFESAWAIVDVNKLNNFVYTHEVGHLFGANHQDAVDANGNPNHPPIPGDPQVTPVMSRPWILGLNFGANPTCYATVMRVIDPATCIAPGMSQYPTIRLNMFSTTYAKYVGYDMGDANHNNAYVIGQNAANITNYHLYVKDPIARKTTQMITRILWL